jgi:enoyl-CoA hydratase
MYTTIEVARDGDVIWLTLDRPEAMNSIDPTMLTELDAVLTDVEQDQSIRCFVVRGRGRAFCSGTDLKASAAAAEVPGGQLALFEAIGRVFDRIAALRMPTVAAVHGWVLAGGLELALCCDLIVAAKTTRIGDFHARYGQLPGGGATVRLTRSIGARRTKYLMFSAEVMTAATMMDWGLVAQVVPDDERDEAVSALAAKLASHSPLGLQRMKELVDRAADSPITTALRAEQLLCGAHVLSADAREGLAAFQEKREPVFEGA